MKKTKTILWQVIISLCPILYFLSIWNNLPESVPLHYNSNLEADSYGSKIEMLGILFFMFALPLGVSLLIMNLNKIDPKKRYASNNLLSIKFSWAVIIFMTLISGFVVYETYHYTQTKVSAFSPKYILGLIALLFVVLGNLMNNAKPNYFIGIRTPWTLEDEENWRLTHHLGSKIWFFGGLIMFVLIMLMPPKYASFILNFSVIILAGVPIFYSYYLFRQKQKKLNSK